MSLHDPATSLYANTEQGGFASDTDLIGVLGFLPAEGEVGCPITVRIQFTEKWNHTQKVSVRLVVHDKPVATDVSADAYGTYKLGASMPHFGPQVLASYASRVPLSVQVLDTSTQTVLDQLTFGDFTYWTSQRAPFQVSKARAILENNESIASAPQIPSNFDPDSRRSSLPASSGSSVMQRTQVERRSRGKSMIASRSKHADDDDDTPHKIRLDIVTPLSLMCENWTPSEQMARRRLVRVRKLQAGSKVVLSLDALPQEDYRADDESPRDCVISCIYFEHLGKYFVTSVDVIYLLQRITNHPGPFPTDEKNRIRRNMEALRPMVIAKTGSRGSESLFTLIMNFPDPKPRNIEKDIKVFEWHVLGQALERVLSKYSLYSLHAMAQEITDVDAVGPASSSSESRLDDVPVSLPSQHDNEPVSYVDSPASVVPKYEMVEPSLYPDSQSFQDSSLKPEQVFSMGRTSAPPPPLRRTVTSDSVQSGGSHDGWSTEPPRQHLYHDYSQPFSSPPPISMQVDSDGWGSAIHYDPSRRQQ